MKAYLAGPMSGVPEFNVPTFLAAADYLRRAGYDIFNPAEHDMEITGDKEFYKGLDGTVPPDGLSYRTCLKADLGWICDNAEALFLLPNWEASKGVAAELALAEALGITVYEIKGDIDDFYYYERIR